MSSRFAILTRFLLACSLFSIVASAGAQQEYPTKPVRIIVPFPPGGSTDFLARLFGAKLTDLLGRQFVIDNRGGGNTIIGTEAAARAGPDGYTLFLATSTLSALPHLYRTLPYDTIGDFASVAGVARSEFVLVVHPSLPASTVPEFIALAKKRPGEINYATSSTGGPTHLSAVMFQMLADVKMQQVAYKGGSQAMSDLLGGQVQAGFANPSGVIHLVKAGRLKAIAVTGDKRLESLPQLPTFTESGLPGLALKNWYAIMAPTGTPRPIIDRPAAAIAKAGTLPDVKEGLVKQGLDGFRASPEQMDAIIKEDLQMVGKIIKAGNIKL
jgi:tripartite-type tricarboxylate transporter receptor subunit TctC